MVDWTVHVHVCLDTIRKLFWALQICTGYDWLLQFSIVSTCTCMCTCIINLCYFYTPSNHGMLKVCMPFTELLHLVYCYKFILTFCPPFLLCLQNFVPGTTASFGMERTIFADTVSDEADQMCQILLYLFIHLNRIPSLLWPLMQMYMYHQNCLQNVLVWLGKRPRPLGNLANHLNNPSIHLHQWKVGDLGCTVTQVCHSDVMFIALVHVML